MKPIFYFLILTISINLHAAESKCVRLNSLHDSVREHCGAVVLEEIENLGVKHINDRDINGDTPLHISVSGKRWIITSLLIYCGADVDVKNRNGETPIDIAKKNNDPNMREILYAQANRAEIESTTSSHQLSESADSEFSFTHAQCRTDSDSQLPSVFCCCDIPQYGEKIAAWVYDWLPMIFDE